MSAPEHGSPGRAPARLDAPRRAGGLGRRTVGEVVAHAMDELEVRREFGVTGWATGIASLDGRIRQVMAPGRVVCIAGGTKSGKTALAGQIVVALAAQGVPGSRRRSPRVSHLDREGVGCRRRPRGRSSR